MHPLLRELARLLTAAWCKWCSAKWVHKWQCWILLKDKLRFFSKLRYYSLKSYYFRMCISAVFGIFTVFFNHYHYLLPEYWKETPYSLPLTTTDLLFVCMDLFILDILYKQNHTMCGLCVWLLSLRIMFSRLIHSTSFLLWLYNIPSYRCINCFFKLYNSPSYRYINFFF